MERKIIVTISSEIFQERRMMEMPMRERRRTKDHNQRGGDPLIKKERIVKETGKTLRLLLLACKTRGKAMNKKKRKG